MFYCEGKNCSRRDKCAYHEDFEWQHSRQVRDASTECSHAEGHSPHYSCGDNADHYYGYKALGFREGEEYKNSEGTICDEVCLSCSCKSLCFCVLECAGMVFRPGDRVRFNCEEIKANPKHYKEWLLKRGWSKELLEELL